MNTNALENKINAVEIIRNIASNMGPAFFEQVEPVAKLFTEELISYNYSKAVRKNATKTLSCLLYACQDSNHMIALWTVLYPPLKSFIELKMSKFDCKYFKSLMNCSQ